MGSEILWLVLPIVTLELKVLETTAQKYLCGLHMIQLRSRSNFAGLIPTNKPLQSICTIALYCVMVSTAKINSLVQR